MNANNYVGDGFWDKVYEMGHLHSLSIFWDPIYLTTDANVIKVWRRLVTWSAQLIRCRLLEDYTCYGLPNIRERCG